MYAENKPATKRNDTVLNYLSGEVYRIKAKEKIPDNCKYTLVTIQTAQNQKQTNLNLLKKVFEKCMQNFLISKLA